mgnify:CR=1 FL=1
MDTLYQIDKYEELKSKISAMRIISNDDLKQKYKEMHLKTDENIIMFSGLFLFCRGVLRSIDADEGIQKLIAKYDKEKDGLEELENLFRQYNHSKWMRYKYEKLIGTHIKGKELYMKTLINFAMGLFGWD